MKLQLSSSNYAANTQSLHRRLLTICILFTGIAANSIVTISLTSHDAVAIQPHDKVETSTVKKEPSIRSSQPINSRASSLGGEIKLDCSTRINLLQSVDCPVGGGDEPFLNIPKEPIYRQQNQNNVVPESDQLKVPLFEMRF
jgi:hypothetical protein